MRRKFEMTAFHAGSIIPLETVSSFPTPTNLSWTVNMTEQSDVPQVTESQEEPWPMLRAQPRSFFKSPLCTDLELLDADVAFIGVPFDQGTFGRPGARFGPDAIRDAPRAYSYTGNYGQKSEAEGFFDIAAGDEPLGSAPFVGRHVQNACLRIRGRRARDVGRARRTADERAQAGRMAHLDGRVEDGSDPIVLNDP